MSFATDFIPGFIMGFFGGELVAVYIFSLKPLFPPIVSVIGLAAGAALAYKWWR